MKLLIAITIAILMSIPLIAQQSEGSRPLTREDYLKKSKGQLTGGVACVLGGIIMESIAAATALAEAGKQTDYEFRRLFEPGLPARERTAKGSGILFLTGSMAVIAGIHLFIRADVNRRKAKAFSVSVKPEIYSQPQVGGLSHHMIPSLSLKIGI